MKRHGDDGYNHGYNSGIMSGNKRQRPDSYQEALSIGKYELRLLVPGRGAGAIIGRGGETIKRLRSECDASVTIPDSQTPERIVAIVAEVDNVLRCVSEIIPKLDEIRETNSNDSELRILVHQSHAGAVIGRSGSRIKELREETNTQLKVFSQCCPQSTERVVQISGAQEKIIACLILIINMLKEIPIKGTTRPYESMFHDPMLADDYGGYGGDRSFPAFSRNVSGYSGNRGPRGPFNGRGPMPMGGGGGYAPQPFGGPVHTTQVTIPNELGGTIIGKGGERINRIREESGAHIVIEPQHDNSERIITVSGTQQQISSAQFLLQQCVRTSVAGRKYLSVGRRSSDFFR